MARIGGTWQGEPGPARGLVRGGGDAPASPTRQRRAGHLGLAALTGAVAASAYLGALGLISGFLPLGAVVTSRLPFASPVAGGIALMIVVAIPATVSCWLAAQGDRRTGAAVMLFGLVLVGWIVVELAIIGQLSFFHPLFGAVGGLLIWLGYRARPRREPETGRR